MRKGGAITHDSISGKDIWDIAREYGREIGVEIKAHDLRKTSSPSIVS